MNALPLKFVLQFVMNLVSDHLILASAIKKTKNKNHSVAIDCMKRCLTHINTNKDVCTQTHMLKCQRGNELLIREYAPERSLALINFVPASDKERRGNMVNLVSMETSSIQLELAVLEFSSVKPQVILMISQIFLLQ